MLHRCCRTLLTLRVPRLWPRVLVLAGAFALDVAVVLEKLQVLLLTLAALHHPDQVLEIAGVHLACDLSENRSAQLAIVPSPRDARDRNFLVVNPKHVPVVIRTSALLESELVPKRLSEVAPSK